MDQNQNAPRPGEHISIPVGQIKTGFNYRRRFDEKTMADLVEDVKQRHITQPVLVRKLDDGGYQLIAGHRRVIALTTAFGPDEPIPAQVRVMTDAEAMAAMVSENYQREDPSAIEDAEAAARMLGMCNGDKAEAARRLNWNPQMLDRRLAIMNAIQQVRDAYLDKKIELGHVEILAAMRRETQETVIKKLLEAPATPTVAQLKAMAEQVLMSLEAAIFSKEQCTNCQFNTGYQQTMFDTSFEGTRCTNRECFSAKTEQELETRRQALTETYQVVRIVRAGDNMTVTPLRADGPKGVGEEQALACRTCGSFGACVSALPDKLGMSFKDICFDSTCHGEKVAARVKAEKEAQSAATKGAGEGNPAEQTSAATAGATAPAAKEPKPQGQGKPTKTASSEPRNVVKEAREEIWRGVFKRAAVRLALPQSRSLLIALCLFRPRTLDSHEAAKAVAKALGMEQLSTLDAGELMSTILQLEQKGLSDALQQIPAFVSKDLEITAITKMMTALDVKIEDFWKINEAFLDLLTKVEIDAVCVELGIDKAMKDYAKVKNGGKADFIKAVMNIEGFEYKGKIPALMRW